MVAILLSLSTTVLFHQAIIRMVSKARPKMAYIKKKRNETVAKTNIIYTPN